MAGNAFTKSYPGKAIWTLIAVLFNAVRLPLWIAFAIVPSARPHPAWSFRQTVRVKIIRAFLYNAAVVDMKTPLPLGPGAEKQRWDVMKVAKKSYYTGVAAIDPEIKPEDIGGTWYPAKPSLSDDKKLGQVILHFHGGAFVIGDGREADAGFAARTLVANTDATHAFCPAYRLASNHGGRFPAALQDAITSYCHLVYNLGIAPSKITLSGDSAGANLVLCFVRYLADHGSSIGLMNPRAALLHSPWINPQSSYKSYVAFNSSPNKYSDYICAEFGTWGADAYCPHPSTGLDITSKYISFHAQPFATPVPLYISTGECEVLLHDDVRLYEEFRNVKGNKVHLQIEEHAVHDIILTGKLNSFDKEAQKAAKRAGDWLRTLN